MEMVQAAVAPHDRLRRIASPVLASVVRSRVASVCACVLCLLAIQESVRAEPVAPASPRDIIEESVQDVIVVLRNDALSKTERLQRIESIALKHFDVELIGRQATGRNWRDFTATERGEYLHHFQRYLANYYGRKLDRYDQEDVDVHSSRFLGNGDAMVYTRVVGGRYPDMPINYQLRQRDENWRIVDVEIDGVSLRSYFRDQVAAVIERQGKGDLLAMLRDKAADTESEQLDLVTDSVPSTSPR